MWVLQLTTAAGLDRCCVGAADAPGGRGYCESQPGLGISPGDCSFSAPLSVACWQMTRIIICLKFY